MPPTACLVPRAPVSKGTTVLSGSLVQPVPEHERRVRPKTGDKSTYSSLLLTWKSGPGNPLTIAAAIKLSPIHISYGAYQTLQ
jgi:hypothetical protein